MTPELPCPGGAVGAAAPPHVLVFPFPAQGHMIPILDLAHLVSLRGLSVTVLVTPNNLPLLSHAPSITPLVLPFPSSPSLPPGVENIKGLPFQYFLSMMHAISGLRQPILQWARSTPSPPDAIISDFFLGWTQSVAAELGIPRIVFCPSGALTLSIVHCLWREMPKRDDPEDDAFPLAFPGVPNSPVYPWRHLSPLYRAYREGDPVQEFVKQGFLDNTASWGYAFNTFEDLEAPYLRHLRSSDLGHPRVWAVGPLLPPDAAAAAERGGRSSAPVLGWLDSQPDGSVVYVCFGSQAALSRPQAEAVAAALERSGARFVWCLREADGVGEAAKELEERTGGSGVVVRGWAPQVAILGHPAVGSFLTHCGWNSVLEGVAAGVALLAWPMSADQFMSARLLVEEAGVAAPACEGADAVPDPDELARAIAESVEGSRPEKARTLALRAKAVAATREGGSSHRQLGELVDELRKLKQKQKNLTGVNR